MSNEFNNGDMPASPIFNDDGRCTPDLAGLTKRERFAMAAMQAILSNHSLIGSCNDVSIEYLRVNSVKAADALLAELAKEHQ